MLTGVGGFVLGLIFLALGLFLYMRKKVRGWETWGGVCVPGGVPVPAPTLTLSLCVPGRRLPQAAGNVPSSVSPWIHPPHPPIPPRLLISPLFTPPGLLRSLQSPRSCSITAHPSPPRTGPSAPAFSRGSPHSPPNFPPRTPPPLWGPCLINTQREPGWGVL